MMLNTPIDQMEYLWFLDKYSVMAFLDFQEYDNLATFLTNYRSKKPIVPPPSCSLREEFS